MEPLSFSHLKKKKNASHPLRVVCQISGRELSFYAKSHAHNEGETIIVDLLGAPSESGKQKKICQLYIEREDLLKALEHVHPMQYADD